MTRDAVYLIQTDTTVGFISQNPLSLARAKHRDPKQPFLLCVDSFKKQKKLTRTPKYLRKKLRRATKTTFIFPNTKAIRVVQKTKHHQFLKQFDFVYSSSANENTKRFDAIYAVVHADIIVEDSHGFLENSTSKIFYVGKKKIAKLR